MLYVRWKARIPGLLNAIINSRFWVIVGSFFLSNLWNFRFEYFLSSLSLEIDIWLFQLQSYYIFLCFNLICCWNFFANPSSTLDLSSPHCIKSFLGKSLILLGMVKWLWSSGGCLNKRAMKHYCLCTFRIVGCLW